MKNQCISEQLQSQVLRAIDEQMSLNIVAGNSKRFLGRSVQAKCRVLDISAHCGIIEYNPCELVLTARAGTPLKEVEKILAENGQMLPFEPPHFAGGATLGGAIASGLSGPRRPYAGSARDLVLGCKLLNGRGEILRFGGQVMKNVAGYDVSRLMVGAYGTLGVLLEISLKVLPRPVVSTTYCHECKPEAAIRFMNDLLRRALPVDGACYYKGQCYVRISGSQQAVTTASNDIPGEALSYQSHFWQNLRDHQLSFFQTNTSLWRISCKPATAPIKIKGIAAVNDWLLDWGGAQRWLVGDIEAGRVRDPVLSQGGHTTCFRGIKNNVDVFQPLSQPMLTLQQRLKKSFDPLGLFNPGRMYAAL
ncbi:MAG: glycolate oxidase subunit GlcE [Gammaproteobacteria bacterium]|nr:glycolate oxidase subunit GlcE [Gammaproteobacteria bacterium]